MYGIFKDQNGNISSKRILGGICMIVGLLEMLTVGIIAIFKIIADPETALTVGKTLVIVGGGLVGISVLEFLKPSGGSDE